MCNEKTELEVDLAGQTMVAHVHKTLFWPETDTLLVSDPHFGKVNHFRKFGIAVPNEVMESNFYRLEQSIDAFKPAQVIFLGDLFHSEKNEEWELLKALFEDYSSIDFHLVIGNHDIINRYELEASGLTCHEELQAGPFVFSHYPKENHDGPLYNLAGHLHPGIRLRGGPGQSMRLPCFYFTPWQGILPAFGAFTGTMRIKPRKTDQVIVIARNELISFSGKPFPLGKTS